MKRIALIPAYMPDEKMIGIVRSLYESGFKIIMEFRKADMLSETV